MAEIVTSASQRRSVKLYGDNHQDMPEQEHLVERMVEQGVDTHVRWSLKEFGPEFPCEVCTFSQQDRISQRTVEHFSTSAKSPFEVHTFQVKIFGWNEPESRRAIFGGCVITL